jgi:hypothetical protein
MGLADEELEENNIPASVIITLEVVSVLVMVVGIPGNLLTLITVAHCKRLHTSGTVLIALLSLADALYYITVLPFRLALFAGAWPDGPGRWLCAVSAGAAHWIFGVSMSCMSCIAFNRYTHVLHPRLYKILFSSKGLVLQFGTMWVLLGVLTLLFPLAGIWGDFVYHHDVLSCTFNSETRKDRFYKYLVVGIGLTVPCVFIITCYSLIYYNVRTSQKRLQSWTKVKPNSKVAPKTVQPSPIDETADQKPRKSITSYPSKTQNSRDSDVEMTNVTSTSIEIANDDSGEAIVEPTLDTVNPPTSRNSGTGTKKQPNLLPLPVPLSQQEKQRRASLRMTAMMVLTFGVFLVFMAPYLILGVIDPDHKNQIAYMIGLSLTWWNGCLNPVIYVAMNGQFRRATKEILRCRRQQQGVGQEFTIGSG